MWLSNREQSTLLKVIRATAVFVSNKFPISVGNAYQVHRRQPYQIPINNVADSKPNVSKYNKTGNVRIT